MTRENKKLTVDKSDWIKFKSIADNFYDGAISEMEMERWNSTGLLIVHSAIAYADTLTVKFGGVKSNSDNHQYIVKLLDNLIDDPDFKKNALMQLERLIAHKSTVAYSGELYDKADIDKLFKHLERFKIWVDKKLQRDTLG